MSEPNVRHSHESHLTTALARLSGELEALHNDVQRLENVIGKAIPSWQDLSEEDASCIQQLDLVRQTLGELSRYVSGLKDLVPSDLMILNRNLLNMIRLKDLASRLGQARSVSAKGPASRRKDIELF